MKSYTDISQSKQLEEILPIESADMWWLYITAQGKRIAMMNEEPDPYYLARMESYGIKDAAIRCWSLAALLGVLPACIFIDNKEYDLVINKYNRKEKTVYDVSYEGTFEDCNLDIIFDTAKNNPIDVCYETIIKLHKQKIL